MEFEKDITGYGRKMGRDAGLNAEGRMEGVHKLGDGDYGGMQPSGTIAARTITPGDSEVSGGQGNLGDYAPTHEREKGVAGDPRGGAGE